MAASVYNTPRASSLSDLLIRARAAQERWGRLPVRDRLTHIRRVRGLLAERADELASSINRPTAETLSAEVLPLAEACKFLENNAERLLAARRARGNTPIWLRSVRLTISREPLGVVLIIGPANYPLFLPGVQLFQALAAGNAVLLKPGTDGTLPASMLVACCRDAGIPEDLIGQLDESPESVHEAIRCGVDKVLLTGSSATGRTVLQALAPRLTPATMELSGDDPVFVLPDADVALTAAAIRFGISLNSGNTCIRPRRVFADPETMTRLRAELGRAADEVQLLTVASTSEALQRASESPYALGACVFGSAAQAHALAARIRCGVVVVNDMIVPTAHPELPFGGKGESGYGVTRGAEGLLELTSLKTIATQTSQWRPHLEPAASGDAALFSSFIRMLHGSSLRRRLTACGDVVRALRNRGKEKV